MLPPGGGPMSGLHDPGQGTLTFFYMLWTSLASCEANKLAQNVLKYIAHRIHKKTELHQNTVIEIFKNTNL